MDNLQAGRSAFGRGVLGVLCALCFTGCFDYKQEIWIQEDRTARVCMDFGMSEMLVSMAAESGQDPWQEVRQAYSDAQEEIAAHPHVTICTLDNFSEGGFRRIALDITIPDANLLLDPEFTEFLSGHSILRGGNQTPMDEARWRMRFEEGPGRRVAFVQDIALEGDANAPGMPPGGANDPVAQMGEEMGRAMLGSMFGNSGITVILHAPDLQAETGTLNLDRTAVSWHIPLMELAEKGSIERELRADYVPPRNWTPWIIAGIVAWIGIMTAVVAAITILRRQLRAEAQGG